LKCDMVVGFDPKRCGKKVIRTSRNEDSSSLSGRRAENGRKFGLLERWYKFELEALEPVIIGARGDGMRDEVIRWLNAS
jgi:hypothetical protein